MARLARLTAAARLAIAVLITAAALVAITVTITVAIAIILVAAALVSIVVAVIAVALFDTVAEALIAVIGHIVFFGFDLIIGPGIAARLTGLDEAEIMFGVLVEILRPHPVARQRRIARQLNVFIKNLGSITADFYVRTIALIAAIGGITRLPSTAALTLVIARPCFPAIHI